MSEKIKIEYRKTIGILILAFIALGFLVNATNLLESIDREILGMILEDENPSILLFAKFMGWLGSVLGYVLVGLGLLIYCLKNKSYEDIKLYTLTSIAVGIINQLLKLYYQRERPVEFFRMDKAGMSFPSGHAMGAMAIYIVVSYILARRFPKYRKLIGLCAGIIVITMGWSRLYLGIHWPTDIVGGYLGGAVVGLVMINLERRGYKVRKD